MLYFKKLDKKYLLLANLVVLWEISYIYVFAKQITVEFTLLSPFCMGNNPTQLQSVNDAAMLVNSIKCLFIVIIFRKNEHPSPDDNYFLIFHTLSWSY